MMDSLNTQEARIVKELRQLHRQIFMKEKELRDIHEKMANQKDIDFGNLTSETRLKNYQCSKVQEIHNSEHGNIIL